MMRPRFSTKKTAVSWKVSDELPSPEKAFWEFPLPIGSLSAASSTGDRRGHFERIFPFNRAVYPFPMPILDGGVAPEIRQPTEKSANSE